jgi:S-adenosylmethionine-dependent methyltransferase
VNHHTPLGKNFDDLADKFQHKVYGGLKGDIRLAVLEKDLSQFFPSAVTKPGKTGSPLHILDAGGGYGPFSLELARLGHHVTLCDISARMLEKAEQRIKNLDLPNPVRIIHAPIQELEHKIQYDLILCHAVIDWVDDPNALIGHLKDLMKENALLSLTFYNLHGMIFKNLLRTNYKKIIQKQFNGWPGSLTPTHPQIPAKVIEMLNQLKLKVVCHSGIRVFHDYILTIEDRDRKPDTVLALELEYSRQPPFRDLGRYQHIMACKIVK